MFLCRSQIQQQEGCILGDSQHLRCIGHVRCSWFTWGSRSRGVHRLIVLAIPASFGRCWVVLRSHLRNTVLWYNIVIHYSTGSSRHSILKIINRLFCEGLFQESSHRAALDPLEFLISTLGYLLITYASKRQTLVKHLNARLTILLFQSFQLSVRMKYDKSCHHRKYGWKEDRERNTDSTLTKLLYILGCASCVNGGLDIGVLGVGMYLSVENLGAQYNLVKHLDWPWMGGWSSGHQIFILHFCHRSCSLDLTKTFCNSCPCFFAWLIFHKFKTYFRFKI